jgi:hypothetical protein
MLPDHERGGQKTERLRVIDWENFAANDFLLVSQFSLVGSSTPVGLIWLASSRNASDCEPTTQRHSRSAMAHHLDFVEDFPQIVPDPPLAHVQFSVKWNT